MRNFPSLTTVREDGARQFYLDWLRILAFGLLVVFHVGMYYVTWDWHIKSPHMGTVIEPWMRLLSPWRMDLLFLISGAATALMWRRHGADGAALRERSARLLWPLLFGVLVVVPPQSYLEVMRRFAFDGSYLEFLSVYLRPWRLGHQFCESGAGCLILPTWNHLWYLPYLFGYTVLLWVVLRRWPRLIDALAATLSKPLSSWGLLLWPLLWLVATRLGLARQFPVTHALADDWFAHAQYLPMFLFGAVLARAGALATTAQECRWLTLLLAIAAWALMEWARGQGMAAPPWLAALVHSLMQWCAMLAALGFARQHMNVDNAARRYLTEAVFPLYILHQTLIILLAHWLRSAVLDVWLEAFVLVLGTVMLSLLAFEGLRRWRWLGWLRPFIGLKSREQQSVSMTVEVLPGKAR
ncbi:MAG: acyltransferase family protein [Burkholderiales bacterium]|nr:acyltransferase family protein [Burkholderiales bacterium]